MFVFVVNDKVSDSPAISKPQRRIVRGTFYFSGPENSDNWTSPHNNSLWQDGMKTLFDPCPTGWRVPQSGEGTHDPWSALKIETGNWATEAETTGWWQNIPAVNRGPAWIPQAGYRIWYLGNIGMVHTEGNNWSSHLSPDRYWILRITSGSIDNGGGCNYPAIGFPVRCIRE